MTTISNTDRAQSGMSGAASIAASVVLGSLILLALTTGARAEEGAAESAADLSCAKEVAARVQDRYEAVRDIEAHFEQTTRSVTLGSVGKAKPSRQRGHVIFAKPGRMRWTYEEPDRSLVVTDGKSTWIYEPDAGEAQRLPSAEGFFTGAALQFLLGEGQLLTEFSVVALRCGGEGEGQQDTAELALTPRQPASYERLGMVARRSTGEILETTIVNLLGDSTRISFSKVRENRDPPPDTFIFEPPAGVDVIDIVAPR